jgi:hypothetical protein
MFPLPRNINELRDLPHIGNGGREFCLNPFKKFFEARYL